MNNIIEFDKVSKSFGDLKVLDQLSLEVKDENEIQTTQSSISAVEEDKPNVGNEGDAKEENYHVESNAQKGAFDFLIKDQEGKSFRNEGKTNEDYYAFGKRIISPSEGEVVLVVDGVKDNIPGKLNPIYLPGNSVIIKTENNEFLFFAHFIKDSIVVSEGQAVKQGDLLGLCGNSGNSSEPHLHFHIQNVEDMNEATGAKTYFEKILVDGKIKRDYSPVRNQKVRNAN